MIGKLKYSFDVSLNIYIVVNVRLAQTQFARIGTQSPERSRMFEYQRAPRGQRAPDLAIPETDLQILLGIVPQEFVQKTGALPRGGMVRKGGTRYQFDQTHCKTKGQSIPSVITPPLCLFVTVSSSIGSFLYDASRNAPNNPTVLRSVQ